MLAIENTLQELKGPSGTQRAQAVATLQATVDYLASLKEFSDNGSSTSSGTVPADDAWHYFPMSPSACEIVGFAMPTRKCVITASLGEASVTPGGSFVIGAVTFELTDANGAVVSGYQRGGFYMGRVFTSQRVGLSISTGPAPVAIQNTTLNPGPYTARLFGAMWVSSLNTTAASTQFNSPTLRVEIVGSGVGA
jgi:hypothetical protein